MGKKTNAIIILALALILSGFALADQITVPVRFIIPSTLSFTLAIPSINTSAYTASGQTATEIRFNSTSGTILQLNASPAGGAGGDQQNATNAIFNFTNTGNTAINITGNFSSWPAAVQGDKVEAKIGWAALAYQNSCGAPNAGPPSTTTCSNLTGLAGATPFVQTTFANLSTSGTAQHREVWMWADYNTYGSGSDTPVNLVFNSTYG